MAVSILDDETTVAESVAQLSADANVSVNPTAGDTVAPQRRASEELLEDVVRDESVVKTGWLSKKAKRPGMSVIIRSIIINALMCRLGNADGSYYDQKNLHTTRTSANTRH
jgi:hypothetical protein